MPQSRCVFRLAFTLIELLVVMAIVAILASLILPRLSRTKSKAQSTACLNNHRQLGLGWQLYADNNRDNFPENYPGSGFGKSAIYPCWVAGEINYLPDNRDNTNFLNLVPGLFGSIGPYVNSARVYHCPSDRSWALHNGIRLARVRSSSLNVFMGSKLLAENSGWEWRFFTRSSDLTAFSPSKAFTFIDEHEDTVVSGTFVTPISAWPNTGWNNIPAGRHNGVGVVGFADCHVELKKWLDRRTLKPVDRLPYGSLSVPKSVDVIWLQEHTSVPKL